MRLDDVRRTEFAPVVPMTDELGLRLRKALHEVPMADDEAVEDLLWEAEVAYGQGDVATVVAALELLGA